MAGRSLRIGELDAQVSLRPSALRYYEQIGLIPPPERIGDQRAYPPSTVRRYVDQDGAAEQAGLPLAETRTLFTGAPQTCGIRETIGCRDDAGEFSVASDGADQVACVLLAARRTVEHGRRCV